VFKHSSKETLGYNLQYQLLSHLRIESRMEKLYRRQAYTNPDNIKFHEYLQKSIFLAIGVANENLELKSVTKTSRSNETVWGAACCFGRE